MGESDGSKVKDVKPLHTVSDIESLSLLMTIGDEAFLLVLIYRPPPGSIPKFVQSLEIELSQVRGQIPPRKGLQKELLFLVTLICLKIEKT